MSETEKSNVCYFTFNAQPSQQTINVTGVQRSWNYLKLEFDRHSDGLSSPHARYYQTLHAGPRLFAVDENNWVYYHDQERWTKFLSARDVRFAYDPGYPDDDDIPDGGYTMIKPQIIPINAQWYVKRQEERDAREEEQDDHWQPYSDVENEILEEAYQQNSPTNVRAELDDSWVDFAKMMEIKKSDDRQQYRVKRVMKSNDRMNNRIRARFSDPPKLLTATGRTDRSLNKWCPVLQEWMKTPVGKQCLFDVKICVRKGIEGILKEGRNLQVEVQAKKLVEPLEKFQGRTIYEAAEVCVTMYTRDSFLYRLVNKVLREDDSSKMDTLGPYCYLLRAYIRRTGSDYSGNLYRGCQLSDEDIDRYRHALATKEWKTWASFTSTSKREDVARMFGGNTMFTIRVEEMDMFLVRAFDVQCLSNFPDEEEVLLPAGALFQVSGVDPGQEPGKWNITLRL